MNKLMPDAGGTDLVFLTMFSASAFESIHLPDWLNPTPPTMIAAHRNMPPRDIAKFPKTMPL